MLANGDCQLLVEGARHTDRPASHLCQQRCLSLHTKKSYYSGQGSMKEEEAEQMHYNASCQRCRRFSRSLQDTRHMFPQAFIIENNGLVGLFVTFTLPLRILLQWGYGSSYSI